MFVFLPRIPVFSSCYGYANMPAVLDVLMTGIKKNLYLEIPSLYRLLVCTIAKKDLKFLSYSCLQIHELHCRHAGEH
jgi:hypothetical protein